MKFYKKFLFGKKNIEVNLTNLIYKKKNLFIFGYPKLKEISKLNEQNINREYKNISGYFFIMLVKKDSLVFYTDVVSNYKVYFKIEKNNLFIFDDENIKNYIQKDTINKNYLNFFIEKNYTPGNLTFFKNIKKFQPCTCHQFNRQLNIKKKILFPNIKNNHDENKCKIEIKKYFKNQFEQIKNEKIILLFSGGLDSYFLYKSLKENNIKFKCAYFYTFPKSYETEKNFQKVKYICKNDEISLDLIKVDLKYLKSTQNFIKKKMMFNYHFSLIFLKGIEYLRKKYGKNVLIISGQSCDSILSFGPSQTTVPNFFARYLINFPFSIFSKIIPYILNLKFKQKLNNPKNLKEFYQTFFKSFYYYALNYPSKSKNSDFFNNLLIETSHISHRYSKLMFLKCYGFLQGSDNMVMIKSANYNKISKIYLPFASYNFISIILKYYNFKKDVFYPKYILKKLCKDYDRFENKKNNFNFDINLSKFDLKLKKNYINYIRKKYGIKS